jgi:hypothetical protein|tara:strand:- start:232 stop:600 length:369 start_codon:yes stop_codon:yes gene_type:complete
MTIKLALLKSGEDVITDMTEMCVGDEENKRVVGYFFDRPCIVKMRNPQQQPQTDGNEQKAGFEVSLFPWMPLSADKKIPITADWLITMVEPTAKLKEMYLEDVLNGPNSKDNPLDNKSESDK